MSRSARLLDLIQLLRAHRRPVSGAALAGALGVSLRTLYRDIATLQAQGADIDGAPGVGYKLKPGFLLPPIMLREEEIEALVLGMRWVASRTDPTLEAAASHALAKIAAVLPPELRRELERTALLVPRPLPGQSRPPDLTPLRAAIRACADETALLTTVFASAGFASNQCVSCSLQIFWTNDFTSVLPSLVLV